MQMNRLKRWHRLERWRVDVRELSAWEKMLLAPYIPQRDLDNVRLYIGKMPKYAPLWAVGIARGHHIYIRNPHQSFVTPDDFALLGHELVHVGQYAQGMTWMRYLWACRHGYHHNPYEIEAYRVGALIKQELQQQYGQCCVPTASDLPGSSVNAVRLKLPRA